MGNGQSWSEEAGKDVKKGCKSPLSQLEDKKGSFLKENQTD